MTLERGMITHCLREMSTRLDDAAAVARASVVCAESGSEREAVRIAMDIDALLNEAETLHSTVCLLARPKSRREVEAPG